MNFKNISKYARIARYSPKDGILIPDTINLKNDILVLYYENDILVLYYDNETVEYFYPDIDNNIWFNKKGKKYKAGEQVFDIYLVSTTGPSFKDNNI